jgi:hypothetical protein
MSVASTIKNAIDKFKVDETAPFFAIAPTGSYGGVNSGIKSAYRLKSKDVETKNVIKKSGILSNNLNSIPPEPEIPTLLVFEENPPSSFFEWSEIDWQPDFGIPTPPYSFTTYGQVTSLRGANLPGKNKLISVTVGNSITTIGKEAFLDCTSLTSITIPNSVTSIGKDAFKNCTSLVSVTLPYTVKVIGVGAFSDCTSLTSISLPQSLNTNIENSAFLNCISLEYITIPYTVSNIGFNTFTNSGLTTVTIANPNALGVYSPNMGTPFFGKNDVDIILPT